MTFRPPRFSPPSAHRAPRPPRDAPPAPKLQRNPAITEASLMGDRVPVGWDGPMTEGLVWKDLADRGWKIFGRPNVKGQTLNYAEADVEFQPAIPVAGLNLVKDFYRADFLIIPGRRGPTPGPPYTRGLIINPITTWTHRNSGQDRYRRSVLAFHGYLEVWVDAELGSALYTRTHQVITAALYGGDDSSVDRGLR